MRVDAAAAYVGMSRSMFLRLVGEGVMPRPVKIASMATWDRYDLDAAFDALKESNEPSENTVHKRLRELSNGK
jgi:predicted DNA-binding transcriptional regulator AlpA